MSVKYRQLVLIGCNCVGQRERERRVVDFGAKEGPEVYDVHGNMRGNAACRIMLSLEWTNK